MNKEAKELREMSSEELIKEKKKLTIQFLMSSPNMVSPKIHIQNHGLTRRRIARINTILGERKLRGVAREEIRLK